MGLGQGRQKYAYLPYPESDFIFAIVGEDFGLLGCLVVIALFVALMIAGLVVSLIKARKAANQPEQSESLLGPDPRDLKPDHVRAMDFAITVKSHMDQNQSK